LYKALIIAQEINTGFIMKFFCCIVMFCLSTPFLLSGEKVNSNPPKAKETIKYTFTSSVNEEFPVSSESIASRAGRKFVRGLTNVLTGVGEIPRQMIISYDDDGPWAFIPVGFFTGIFMTVVRTGYGVFEVGTFIAPIEGTYDSLIEPPYVWGPINYKVEINLENKE
jgi:putative exosortase-associated protein (TIGR04073 family)